MVATCMASAMHVAKKRRNQLAKKRRNQVDGPMAHQLLK